MTTFKSETICRLPVAQEFKLPKETVTEVNDIDLPATEEFNHAPIICEFQPAPKLYDLEHPTREFKCEYPTVDPNVTRVREALPFPNELKDVIAWTDAFVDRIASLTRQEEERNTLQLESLAKEVLRLRRKLDITVVDLSKSRDAHKATKDELKTTKEQLDQSKALAATRAKTIDELNKKLASQAESHEKEVAKLKLDIARDQDIKRSLKAKLEKASKDLLKEHEEYAKEHNLHDADHKALDDAHKTIKTLRTDKLKLEQDLHKVKEEKSVLEKKLDTAEKSAVDLKIKLDAAKASDKDGRDQLEAEKKETKKLGDQVKALLEELVEEKKETENTKILLAASEKKVRDLEKELSDLRTSTDNKISTLEAKIKALEDEIVRLNAKIASAKTKKDAAILAAKNAKAAYDKAMADAEVAAGDEE